MFRFFKKWSLILKVLPFLIVVMTLKIIFHMIHWEWLTISPLFSSLLAATVFLPGFLISGVLSDYKESEKLPGEIAVSLEALDFLHFMDDPFEYQDKGESSDEISLKPLKDLNYVSSQN